jgi:hypothetical protein
MFQFCAKNGWQTLSLGVFSLFTSMQRFESARRLQIPEKNPPALATP